MHLMVYMYFEQNIIFDQTEGDGFDRQRSRVQAVALG